MPETVTCKFKSPCSHFARDFREITVESLVGYMLLPADVKYNLQHLGVSAIKRLGESSSQCPCFTAIDQYGLDSCYNNPGFEST